MLRKNLFLGYLCSVGMFTFSTSCVEAETVIGTVDDSEAKTNPQIYLEYLRKFVHFEKNIHQSLSTGGTLLLNHRLVRSVQPFSLPVLFKEF